MEGYLYEVTVYDSAGDYIHDMPTEIEEIYVPCCKLAFNYHGGHLNVLSVDKPRKSETVRVPLSQKLVDTLAEVDNLQSKIKMLKENVSNDVKHLFLGRS